MDIKKPIWWAIPIGTLFCMSLCLVGWLKLDAQRKAVYIEAEATKTQIDTLTIKHRKEVSQLIEAYEYERWQISETPDLTITITHHYVLEYTETRCQAYAAVAIKSQNLYNDYDDRPCGFCAVYVFVRECPQQPWEFGTLLPIMWSADDLARDWNALEELGTYKGLIDVQPRWEPCPYWICVAKE